MGYTILHIHEFVLLPWDGNILMKCNQESLRRIRIKELEKLIEYTIVLLSLMFLMILHQKAFVLCL